MSTGPDHYREAERLLLLTENEDGELTTAEVMGYLAAAQVHATLALALPPLRWAVGYKEDAS